MLCEEEIALKEEELKRVKDRLLVAELAANYMSHDIGKLIDYKFDEVENTEKWKIALDISKDLVEAVESSRKIIENSRIKYSNL